MKKYDRFVTRGYLRHALNSAAGDKHLRQVLIGWIGDSEEELRDMDADFLTWGFRAAGFHDTEEDAPRPSRRRSGGSSARMFEAAKAREYLGWAIEQLDRTLRELPRALAEAKATAFAVRPR